jgi:hypothetical protein
MKTNRDDVPPAAQIGPNGETALEISQAAVRQMCKMLGQEPPPDLGPIDSQVNPADDPIAVPPTFESRWGKAWLCKNVAETPAREAGVAGWIVEASWANCAWHSYAVAVIHLRPIPGVPEAHIAFEGATHQICFFALDPRQPREPSITSGEPVAFLTPVNFAGQFTAANDAEAMERVEADVRLIVEGELSPDTDHRAVWVGRYGGHMMRHGG